MSSKNNIEIEKKFVLEGISLKQAIEILKHNFSCPTTSGKSSDLYWKPPKHLMKKADFLRVRQFGQKSGQLTLKKSLNQFNTTRIEIDVNCLDVKKATTFITQLVGQPTGKITKTYFCLFLTPSLNISVYKIVGDNRIFLEIEADKLSKVNETQKKVEAIFSMKLENKSLYQLFIK